MRSKGKHIIWPAYFDVTLSREEGRRVPKSLASRTPTTENLVKAALAAGFKAELQPGSAHPRTPFIRTGYVLVDAKVSKAEVIKKIASQMSK